VVVNTGRRVGHVTQDIQRSWLVRWWNC